MVNVRRTQRLWLIVLMLVSIVTAGRANAALTASVDRTTVAKNDIIQLTIRSDTGPIEHTDFTALEQNFSVINRQRSNQISIINGQKTAIYDLHLTLFPINAGRFTIPAFKSRGESSQPIEITVADTSTETSQQHEEVFLKTLISKSEVYVQEPLVLTVQLFHSVGLRDAQLTSLDVENAVIDEIGDQEKSEKILNGVRYSVIEKHYSITPEKSGQLTIPALTFSGRTQYRGVYADPGRYVRTRSMAHRVEVLAKPDIYPANAPWLPTSALSISDSWDGNPPTLTVGESVTRTLTLSALNLNAAQLPDLSLPTVPGLKLYPDQSRNENTATKSGMLGQRIFSTAIVATQPGDIKIPEQTIYWWNTSSKKLEQTIIPAVTLNSKAATNPAHQNLAAVTPEALERQNQQSVDNHLDSNATQTAVNKTGSSLWPYLALMFALLWLATLALWWRLARATKINSKAFLSEPPSTQQNTARAAFKAFKKACHNNAAADARHSLIDWFKCTHPQQQISGLQSVSEHYKNAELDTLIRDMEQSLYAEGAHSWQGKALLDCVEALEKTHGKQHKNVDKTALKPLYPF